MHYRKETKKRKAKQRGDSISKKHLVRLMCFLVLFAWILLSTFKRGAGSSEKRECIGESADAHTEWVKASEGCEAAEWRPNAVAI